MFEFTRVAPWDGLDLRDVSALDTVVVHRIQVSQEDAAYTDSVADTARFFLEHPVGKAATGGAIPYPILITPDGEARQTVPLNRVTPHARVANLSGIGVACIGDFRSDPPAGTQLEALVRVCAALCSAMGLDASAVRGHDEITGSSHDPDKECPGRMLEMDDLRTRVSVLLGAAPIPDLVWTDADLQTDV